jgi:hypothetical protein
LIKSYLEKEFNCKVNLMVRSKGGITIGECLSLIQTDTGYFTFRNDKGVINIGLLQLGIVDCGILPFTYRLIKTSSKIPLIGGRIVRLLKNSRPLLQKIYSSPKTSKKEFFNKYKKIVEILQNKEYLVIGIGLPKPTNEIEKRSPGFQNSASQYNQLIESIVPNFVDVESYICEMEKGQLNSDFRNTILVKEDGHHLTVDGHSLYAELVTKIVKNRFDREVNNSL